jgi:hypothetical protein
VRLRLFALALAAASLAGCGGESSGQATVWITRDKGAHVLLVRKVPAGLTAMQALDRVADIETRYAGRFVQAINGVEGSLAARRDWFYFVNGIQADRSAAEYGLRAGDIEWWDYRSWRGTPEYPIVVGAFPEPLLHGYDGRTRSTAVRFRFPEHADLARGLAKLVHAKSVARFGVPVPRGFNVIDLGRGERLYAANHDDPYGPVSFEIGAVTARRQLADPAAYRYRFSVP